MGRKIHVAQLHPHDLRYDKHQLKYTCNSCKQPGFGPHYSCSKGEGCGFSLHRECADVVKQQKDSQSRHYLFPGDRLELKIETPWVAPRCAACGDKARGLRFKVVPCSSSDNPPSRFFFSSFHHRTSSYLHPHCAALPRKSGKLILQMGISGGSKCLVCRGKAGIKGWAYHSKEGCYHVACARDKISMELAKDGMAKIMTSLKKALPAVTMKLAIQLLLLVLNVFLGIPVSASVDLQAFNLRELIGRFPRRNEE